MAGSVFDSPLYAKMFPTGEIGRLFTDAAEVRAMMLVLGTLAKTQGDAGLIPADSGDFLRRSAMEHLIDPAGLDADTAAKGIPVEPLIDAFAKAMEAPAHSGFLLQEAAPTDIMDTALILRLRQVLTAMEQGATRLIAAHPAQAQALQSVLDDLPALRKSALVVAYSGAIDTDKIRADLAAGLGLSDPRGDWDVNAWPIVQIARWMVRLADAIAPCAPSPAMGGLTGLARALLPQLDRANHSTKDRTPEILILPQLVLAVVSALTLGETAA